MYADGPVVNTSWTKTDFHEVKKSPSSPGQVRGIRRMVGMDMQRLGTVRFLVGLAVCRVVLV